jgi:dipeptidyl aminopeptidase/acylaminoacyl peptidase
MSTQSRSLMVILVVLTAVVLLSGALVAYLAITRQRETDAAASGEPDFPPGAAGGVDLSSTAEQRIAYVTDDSEENERSTVYLIDPDGSDRQRLTGSEDGICQYPSWSPDGQRIAYLVRTPGEDGVLGNGDLFEVWVAPLDGSEHVRISDVIPSIHEARPVAWSPDGTRLAFLGEVEGDTTDTLFVVRADGSEVEHTIPLDFWAIEMMLWSPTGEELLFMPETDTIRMTVHLLSLEDLRIMPIYEVGMLDSWGWGVPLDWAPNGTEFAVANPLAQEILILGTSGELRQVARIARGYPLEIALSPNGAYIAVSVSAEILDAGDTSDMTLQILEVATAEFSAVFHEEGTMVTLPDWSSDGNRLVFTTVVEDQDGWLSLDSVRIYDVTAGALERLATGGWGAIR